MDLIERLEGRQLYNFDGAEFVECRHDLWKEMLAELARLRSEVEGLQATADSRLEECNCRGRLLLKAHAERDEARAKALEEAAKIVEAKEAEILSKQNGTHDPFDFNHSVDLNLRMMSVALPDVAKEIRAHSMSLAEATNHSLAPSTKGE